MSERSPFRIALAALAWVSMAFLVFPVILTAVVSLNDSFFIEFPPKALSFRWYENLAAIHRIGEATAISFAIAVAAAGLATVLALGAALAIARHPFPAKPGITAFLLSPVTLPMVAIGIALVQFFIAIDAAFTWWSLAIGHVVLVIAYPVRTLVASLTLSDTSLEDAARSLGASRWTAFRTVTLPQLKPGLVSGFLFAFLISFDNYPISVFLVRGDLTTMPIEVFNYISNNFDPTPAAFSTVYILVISVVIAAAEYRYRIMSLSIPRS
ncbi:MAG: ABC transporter permease [Alphaproteobacteria bacterium]|nr:ABC transporter permease [Alphaproteobacteria bacterium]MDX5368070.1 ABC transporter permease [Alphaproteobacteria bacterium]MDX5462909.1 ABC transporter permease [Alphaproteobacteria bacterium]